MDDPRIKLKLDEWRAKRDQRRSTRFAEDVQSILSKAEGRRFVKWLLDQSEVFVRQPAGAGEVVNFVNGKKDIGLILWGTMMKHSPESFMQTINEASSERRQDEVDEKKITEAE